MMERKIVCDLNLVSVDFGREIGIRFQVFFTPLVGVLFTFPSRYWFAIGR